MTEIQPIDEAQMLETYGELRVGGVEGGGGQQSGSQTEEKRRTDDRENRDRLEAVPSDCQVNQ